MEGFTIDRGTPLPLGVTKHPSGYNFSLFSKHAISVSLCVFDPSNNQLVQEIVYDPSFNKTGDLWHVFVKNLPAHFHYGYRLDGPYDPFKGLYFDSRHVVLDPLAKQVVSSSIWGEGHYSTHIVKGIVDPLDTPFDWENDAHPNIPLKELIIYEMHARGFTQDASSHVAHPGTFVGIIEKIPYLKSLGVNAIELMPIHEFNENDNIRMNPSTKERLHNYWGYSTVNFFSPMNRYATDPTHAVLEFKTLVKELHANGIEIILDVVYNHTAEGNEQGPILSFKGIENGAYYLLGPNGEYYNFSGCGNTMNANHPVVREMIRESLRYWVQEMHVDGFRFDLASILTRSHDGIPLESPPLVEAISLDPLLANTKLIAEAWDAGGLYQVGSFPSWGTWAEWNGKFRDDIRQFLKGTDDTVGHFATRLCGSEDLYGKGRKPYHSINFITAHDGFSLRDLVSFNTKHNEDNGEDNTDGENNNLSWNCGSEGEAKTKRTLTLRQRQIRNCYVALLFSQGVPMLLMGDEYGHTKRGNNNSWCHDGPINWFAWDELELNRDLWRFVSSLVHFRKTHPILSLSRFLKEEDIVWHGKEPNTPDWTPKSRFIAMVLSDRVNDFDFYIAFNASYESALINLPMTAQRRGWFRIIDTSKKPPNDFISEEQAKPIAATQYRLPPYSSLVLKSKPYP